MLFYGFVNDKTLLVIGPIVFISFWFIDHRKSLMMSVSFLCTTFFIIFALKMTGLERSIYYRTHEMLATTYEADDLTLYKKNARVQMLEKSGDLYAIEPHKDIEKEPRKVRFIADSLGFRNDFDYQGEKVILVGDSFIAGVGNSQEDILSAQLRKYGISAYNLASAGGIPEYLEYISYLQREKNVDLKVLLFLFEGNDFPDELEVARQDREKDSARTLYAKYISFFRKANIYRLTFGLYKRARHNMARSMKTQEDLVRVIRIRNTNMAFLTEYIDVTKRREYEIPQKYAAMLKTAAGRIEHIFFIPTKYRVYYPFIESEDKHFLPNAHWEAVKRLGEKLNIKCTDLTGPLREEAKNLIEKDEFVYWLDDTHWNRLGVAVTARVIYDKIRAGEIAG